MLQAIMEKPGCIKFNNIKKPKPKKNEVLIKVIRIGICGSDIHVFQGNHPYTKYPIIQGHEIYGKVAEMGPTAKNFSIDDQVTVMPQLFCKSCYNCRIGRYNICSSLKVMGFQINGAAQEYFIITDELLIKLNNKLSPEEYTLIEPIAVAVHAIRRGGNVKGKNILIFGAGTIGNLVGQVVKTMGAKTVLSCDINDYKLNIAKKCGVDFTINSKKDNLEESIPKYFGENKADLIFECVGYEETISQAISNARSGTTIVVVGIFSKKVKIDFGLIQDRELKVSGTLMYVKDDYLKALELAEDGKLSLKELISKTYPFIRFNDAYQFIEEQKDSVMKIIMTID